MSKCSTSKLSLSMGGHDLKDSKAESPRPTPRRFDSSSHGGKSNPFNNMAPLNTSTPSASASSAFGLGTGAFASFGSSAKTPKTPSQAFDFSKNPNDKREKESSSETSSDLSKTKTLTTVSENSTSQEHALKNTWVLFYRPPSHKNSDYEKSTIQIASMSTAEAFWTAYSHLKRPSELPTVSDYHLFKRGIRPVWEDEANKKGGKWILRLKKGVADRYWEELLLAILGDQFAEAGEEVCGAVLSVRSGEDVLSIWTKNDGGRNIKIRFVITFLLLVEIKANYYQRETIKRLLAFPPDTNIVWKSHDDSIAQRSAQDQARQERGGTGTGHERRRATLHDESAKEKGK